MIARPLTLTVYHKNQSTNSCGADLFFCSTSKTCPKRKNPFDSLLTFNQRTKNVRNKRRLWQELHRANRKKRHYKTTSRPVANFTAFATQLCNTNWLHLQRAQNASLRITTGCYLMTPERWKLYWWKVIKSNLNT